MSDNDDALVGRASCPPFSRRQDACATKTWTEIATRFDIEIGQILGNRHSGSMVPPPPHLCGYRTEMQSRTISQWRETFPELIFLISGLFSCLVVAAILLFLIYFTIPIIAKGDLLMLLSWDWRPTAGQYGILPMAVGSICQAKSQLFQSCHPVGGVLFRNYSDSRKFCRNQIALLDKPAVAPRGQSVITFENPYTVACSRRMW